MAATRAAIAGRVAAHQRKKLGKRLFSYVEDGDEFRFLDYTPCINRRPMDLPGELRMSRMERHIKLFICVTVFDETIEFLRRTLEGIARNLPFFKEIGVGWEEIGVCVVVDGRSQCNDRLLDYAAGILTYDETMVEIKHNGYDVTMHLFEKSVHLPKHQMQREYYTPMQLVFAVKEQNGGKLNSHLWFTAFCKSVKPTHVCLLQCGNIPADDALVRLYQALEDRPYVAGVGGQISLYRATIANPIEAVQVFENKVLNLMTVAMESVFGYIRGLSGEMAMYRWAAIKHHPLHEYFMMEENSIAELGPLLSNMYLVEDEVLAFGILTTPKRKWTTHYVPGADVTMSGPTTLVDMMKKRRRFINGSFLLWAHYVSKFHTVWRGSNHGIIRKLFLSLQFVVNAMQVTMEWFMMGAYYLAMLSLFSMTFDADKWAYLFNIPYIFLLGINIIYGLGASLKSTHNIYTVSVLLYGLSIVLGAFAVIYHLLFNPEKFSPAVLAGGGLVFAGHVVGAILHGQVVYLIMTCLQYLFMLPSLLNMVVIFSFANMHDISWVQRPGNFLTESKRPRPVNAEKEKSKRNEASNMASQLVKIVGHQSKDTPEKGLLRDEEAFSSLAHVVKKAVETEHVEHEARRWAKVQADMLRQHIRDQATFSGFRNRLMSMWLGTNLVFVILVVQFDVLGEFSFGLACLVLLFMTFKIIGTILFQLERVGRTLCQICCPCCWRRRATHVAESDDDDDDRMQPSEFVKYGVDGRPPDEEVEGGEEAPQRRPSLTHLESLSGSDVDDIEGDRDGEGRGAGRGRRGRRRRSYSGSDSRGSGSYSDRSRSPRGSSRRRRGGRGNRDHNDSWRDSARSRRRGGRSHRRSHRRRRSDSRSDSEGSRSPRGRDSSRRYRDDKRDRDRDRARDRRGESGGDTARTGYSRRESARPEFDAAIQEEDMRFRHARHSARMQEAIVGSHGPEAVAVQVDATGGDAVGDGGGGGGEAAGSGGADRSRPVSTLSAKPGRTIDAGNTSEAPRRGSAGDDSKTAADGGPEAAGGDIFGADPPKVLSPGAQATKERNQARGMMQRGPSYKSPAAGFVYGADGGADGAAAASGDAEKAGVGGSGGVAEEKAAADA